MHSNYDRESVSNGLTNSVTAIDFKPLLVQKHDSVRQALAVIDRSDRGVALVADETMRLAGIITDGDIRRFMLRAGDIEKTCDKVMNRSFISMAEDSMTLAGKLLDKYRIRQIPYLDPEGRIVKLYALEAEACSNHNTCAVILAGGEGKRLKEITGDTPKPLVKVKDKTLIEEILLNLQSHGIQKVYLALNYEANRFIDYLGDGSRWDLDLNYIVEEKKLGTAGALTLLPEGIPETLLVMNADILTKVNFRSLLDFYHTHFHKMSVGAKAYRLEVPFGVFEVNNGFLTGIAEKPSYNYLCNAGIYVISRDILSCIPNGQSFDIPDLIKVLLKKGIPLGVFPIYEYWVDIGTANDFHKAKKEYDWVFGSEGRA